MTRTSISREPSGGTVGSPRPVVLVVEDSDVSRLLLARQLEQLGCRHALAVNGRQALDASSRSRFDLVVMNWHLPGVDGLDTTRHLRDLEADTGRPRVPVIAVTGRKSAGDRQRCLAAGADDLLAKPVGLDDLDTTLRHWLAIGARRPEASPPGGRHDERSTVQAIDRLVGELGDTSIVVTLVRTFLDELPEQRLAITEGAETGDLERVRRAAHTLKSTGRVLGAIDLSDAATELEARARSADGNLGGLARDLDDAAERASLDFVSILESMGDVA